MTLDSKIPTGPLEQKWANAKFEMKLVNPANKRKYNVIVVGTGLAGGVGRRDAGRARLQRRVLLLPGLAAPRALDRRAGRHQRRQELPERRRQRLPPLLRHGQRRRLPLARGERLPPRRGLASTSSISASRRACRSRASTAALLDEPLLRRRAGLAHLLLPAARPASSCCSARTRRSSGRSALGKVKMFRAPRCSTSSSSTAERAASSCATWSPARSRSHAADAVVLATGGYGNVFYPLDERQGLQRHRDLSRVQARRVLRQPVLHADPSDLHSRHRRLPDRS